MRIEQLTFTRFIAAIAIVIFHFGMGSCLFNNDYVSFIFKQANLGVSYFFILSGFVMIIGYNKKNYLDFRKYILAPLTRIYPLYLLAIIIIIGNELLRDIDTEDLILNVFMIQAWIPGKALTLNYPGWSLSVIFFFYITFPVLFNFIYKEKNLNTIAIWIISFWIVSQIVFHLIIRSDILNLDLNTTRNIFYNPLMHLNEFLVGNLTGIYFLTKLNGTSKNYFWHKVILVSILIIALKCPFGLNYHNGLLALVFAPLILFISLSNDYMTKIFNKKIFIFLGDISYGIYILQVPVWIIFSDYRLNKYFEIDKEVDYTLAFLIRFCLLILFSSLSYLYLEKPMRERIKKLRVS